MCKLGCQLSKIYHLVLTWRFPNKHCQMRDIIPEAVLPAWFAAPFAPLMFSFDSLQKKKCLRCPLIHSINKRSLVIWAWVTVVPSITCLHFTQHFKKGDWTSNHPPYVYMIHEHMKIAKRVGRYKTQKRSARIARIAINETTHMYTKLSEEIPDLLLTKGAVDLLPFNHS